MKCRLLFLLILLGGCISPSPSLKEIHQRAAEQIALLIDSGYLPSQYVEVIEIADNDSSVIYRIRTSDSAGSDTDELPSRVIKYKDKYLCFVELDEPVMSRTELFEKGIVADSGFQANSFDFQDGFWALALRKYEDKQVLVKDRSEYEFYITEYPELWPYFSGGSPRGKPLFMTLATHNIIVPDSLLSCIDNLEADSMKHYIDRFEGAIQLKNLTDTTIVLSNNNVNNISYAVVNGADTLRLILEQSLPKVIEPHNYGYLKFNSESPHQFLRKLPDQDTWMSMYKLFCDSTFCFLEINGKPTNFRILHNDGSYFNYIKLDSEQLRKEKRDKVFYNKGVYDKDKKGLNFRGW